MRILHAADFHMDSPFAALPEEKAAERRREQRELLMKLAEKAAEEKTQVVLLSGDLFDAGVSYWETQETLVQALSQIDAEIFIAPGNHDWYSQRSPYAFLKFRENVHIFTGPTMRFFDLPELNCRVWGAGFVSGSSQPLLSGFTAPDDGAINIMALHGELGGANYNPITEADIAASGLDYLALGHVHAFSGIRKAGKTAYAYPGCLEGRGFDETGEKGIIMGEVSKGGCELRFVPMGGRRYEIETVDLTGAADATAAVLAHCGEGSARDIVRLVLTGEFGGTVDVDAISAALAEKYYSVSVKNRTLPEKDIWASRGEDSLTGLFLQRMWEKYEKAEGEERENVALAVRCGLAALEMREGRV